MLGLWSQHLNDMSALVIYHLFLLAVYDRSQIGLKSP